MVDTVNAQQMEAFFQALSERYQKTAVLYLIGGSALMLLGSGRPTQDIDYVGTDARSLRNELQIAIDELATEMKLDVEAVPFTEMIPLTADFERRHILIREYRSLRVFAFDPLGVAIAKLDRGGESDLEDICFLIRKGFITLSQLGNMMQEAILRAQEFDFNPKGMRQNLNAVRQLLNEM